MGPLGFFIDVILSVAQWPWGGVQSAYMGNEYLGYVLRRLMTANA